VVSVSEILNRRTNIKFALSGWINVPHFCSNYLRRLITYLNTRSRISERGKCPSLHPQQLLRSVFFTHKHSELILWQLCSPASTFRLHIHLSVTKDHSSILGSYQLETVGGTTVVLSKI
jgi:hypothetical protein